MSETKEVVKEEGTFKIKKRKPRKLTKKDEPIKIDLSKKPEEKKDAVQEQSTNEKVLQSNEESTETRQEDKVGLQEVVETHAEESVTPKEIKEEVGATPVIQEINVTDDTSVETTNIPPTIEQPHLPENVDKLVNFMNETGGTIEDYIRLNADYTDVKDSALLREYYKQTKPHLNVEEINFLMEDNFHYDEELDEERAIRKKKLAIKEEVAKAKNFLDGLKSKYYEEIKLRPGVTQEQQKAMDFFNRYNKEQDAIKQRHSVFRQGTKDFFTNNFEGFDMDIGEKRFRYNVNNPTEVADTQSDITNIVGKFLDEKGSIKDYKGYHKAIYAAQNVDTIAQHFYEQGKADAIKSEYAKSKNINDAPRATSSGEVYIGGLKVKAISGVDSSKLKIKKRKFNT